MKTILRADLNDARIMITAAQSAATAMGVPVCIAVCDESGHLIAFERMEGAKSSSADIAIDKAFTAASTRKGTHELGAAAQPGKPAYGVWAAAQGRFMIVGGGIAVFHGDDVVAAIGVSSGTPDQDRAIAEAGAAEFAAVGRT